MKCIVLFYLFFIIIFIYLSFCFLSCYEVFSCLMLFYSSEHHQIFRRQFNLLFTAVWDEMLPVELEMADPEEERPIRGLRWSDVGIREVQMQLSMVREAGKMDVKIVSGLCRCPASDRPWEQLPERYSYRQNKGRCSPF